MKYTIQLKKWGDSSGLLVSSQIKNQLNLKDGDFVEVDIFKSSLEREIKNYRCKACYLEFDSNDFKPECPVCDDNPKIEEIFKK